MLAAITNNPDVAFALSLVGLILGGIVVFLSRWAPPMVLAGLGIVAVGLAGTLAWWPS